MYVVNGLSPWTVARLDFDALLPLFAMTKFAKLHARAESTCGVNGVGSAIPPPSSKADSLQRPDISGTAARR